MIADAARTIASTMIREAFAHLPAERSAGAQAMARTEPIEQMLTAITVQAWEEGRSSGNRQGRVELEREMEDDWKPIAERVRAQANAPSFKELERRRNDALIEGSPYTGGPVEVW